MPQPSKDLPTTLNKLSINPSSTSKPTPDSWDDASSSGDDTDRPSHENTTPSAPPPTPISPSYHEHAFHYNPSSPADVRSERGLRPDKTDAVAKRLIAGALGVKAPKRTEEQRAYDRALKEKEIKKRKEEREAGLRAQEEREKAKRTVWED